MPRPLLWHRMLDLPPADPPAADPQRRLRLCLLAFLALVAVVFGRVVQLEVSQGAAFREEAAKPLVRQESLPGVRGRILARNGTVLAYDKQTLALAVHYRSLEEPPDPRWLRSTVRMRLSSRDRKDPQRVAAEIVRICEERTDLARRLAVLCGWSDDQWRRRAAMIQQRVEHISQTVNRRHQERNQRSTQPTTAPPDATGAVAWWRQVGSLIREFLDASAQEPSQAPVTVAEQLAYHVVVENVSLEVAAEVEGRRDAYPGVKIVQKQQRVYPTGPLAAHVLGYLGAPEPEELGEAKVHHPEDRLGRMGLERRYEHLLRAERGLGVEWVDRSGRILASRRQRPPGVGRDLVLTLDPRLQQTVEELLDDALLRRDLQVGQLRPAGGAAVVLSAHNGAVLAAASAPRFDPNWFSGGPARQVEAVLQNPAHPLVNRVTAMAIAPGSVFKVVTTVALLESSRTTPEETFHCRGYLHQPDSWRCALYRRHGVGHGELTLADALARSCNVYFLHHAAQAGPEALIDWARHLGIGSPTGIDLPGESAGVLPTPITIGELENHPWRQGDTLALSIGQGSLQVTPLGIARLMAAVANGGRLVTPHLVSGLALPQLTDDQAPVPLHDSEDPVPVPPPEPVPNLKASTLAAIREGLRRVVADPEGTAYGGLSSNTVELAGKTGTAETGESNGDHAWFAGYAPVDQPKVVLVVALEHAGDSSQTAVPVARRMALRLRQLGYLNRK